MVAPSAKRIYRLPPSSRIHRQDKGAADVQPFYSLPQATNRGNAALDKTTFDERNGQIGGLQTIVSYFNTFTLLSNPELDLLRDLTSNTNYHPPYRDLWAARAPAPPPRMLVSGWACRYRALPNGCRQIISLLLPGDFIGPMSQPRLSSLCAVAALTEVETVSAKPLADAAVAGDVYPGLAHVVRLTNHLQDALLCEQIARLGQQSANERFASLVLELRDRMHRLGFAQNNRFPMPLTQDILADALGLSAVHLNRTVQQLRKSGLLKLEGGVITLLEPQQLQALGGWTHPLRLPSR